MAERAALLALLRVDAAALDKTADVMRDALLALVATRNVVLNAPWARRRVDTVDEMLSTVHMLTAQIRGEIDRLEEHERRIAQADVVATGGVHRDQSPERESRADTFRERRE